MFERDNFLSLVVKFLSKNNKFGFPNFIYNRRVNMAREDNQHQLRVWIKNELWDTLNEEAHKREITVSVLVRTILEECLCQQKLNLQKNN